MAKIIEGSDIVNKLREIINLPDGITYLKLELNIDDVPKIEMQFVPRVKGEDEPTKR